MKQFAQLETAPTDTISAPVPDNTILPNPVHNAQPMTEFCGLSISQPSDRFEREADHTADQVASAPTPVIPKLNVNPLSQQGMQKNPNQSGGKSLAPSERDFFEPRFGRDLSDVSIHQGPHATEMNKQMNARAFTKGQDIYFSDNEFDTTTKSGRHLLAHEITHTLQQSGKATPQIQRDKVAGLSSKIQNKLRFSRVSPNSKTIATSVKQFFDPKEGTKVSTGIPVEVDPVITAKTVITGFESLASELASNSNSKINPKDNTKPLGPNSILDIDVDPSAHGGIHAIYRFIRYTDGKAEKIYVEKLGSAAAAQSDAPTKAATPQPKAANGKPEAEKAPIDRSFLSGTIPVDPISVKIASGFDRDEARTVIAAIQLLPSSTRAKLDGLAFVSSSQSKGSDGASGQYDPSTDEITLYTSAFDGPPRKVGEQSTATYTIIHEIGHAIDLRPQNAAERETAKAKKEKIKQEKIANRLDLGSNEDALDDLFGTQKKDPVRENAKKEIAKLDQKIASLSKKLGKGKSLSGEEKGKKTESLTTGFGKALEKDGIKAVKNAKKDNKAAEAANKANPTGAQTPIVNTLSGDITLYGNTNIMEAFAENFSLYILDPDLLKTLRPNTYKYFSKNFPQDSKAKGTP